MYDYYEELNKVCQAINAYMNRVEAGIIEVPPDELLPGETPTEWAAYSIIAQVNRWRNSHD